jgi:hypothetical protein
MMLATLWLWLQSRRGNQSRLGLAPGGFGSYTTGLPRPSTAWCMSMCTLVTGPAAEVQARLKPGGSWLGARLGRGSAIALDRCRARIIRLVRAAAGGHAGGHRCTARAAPFMTSASSSTGDAAHRPIGDAQPARGAVAAGIER